MIPIQQNRQEVNPNRKRSDIRKRIQNCHPVFLGKVGVGISQEQLSAGQYNQYNLVFLILDEEDQYAGPFEALPAELCATIRFCGSHKDAPAYYRKLAEQTAAQGFQIAGFSKAIAMIDFGLTNDPDQFATEIQIPIESAAE